MPKKTNIPITVGLLLCLPLVCGQGYYFARSSGAAGPTYLIKQGFEGTGYDNSETWTESGTGTANEDSTTSPLDGSQSLRCTTTTQTVRTECPNFTAITEIHGYFLFKPGNTVAAGNSRKIVTLENSGGGTAEGVSLANGENLSITHGGASATTTGALVDGTTYHIWFRWKAKVGASDGEAMVAFSTDGTKPTSGSNFASLSNGTGSSTAMRAIAIGNAPDDSNVTWTTDFDKVRVDDATIGSNPE